MQRIGLAVRLVAGDVELPGRQRAGFRGNPVRHDAREDLEHQFRHQHAGAKAPETRRRIGRIQQAAVRRVQGDRPVGALIVRQARVADHLDRHRHVGAREIDRAIDRAAHLRRGPVEIDIDLIALDLDGDDERLRLVDAVDIHHHFLAPFAVRELAKPGADTGFRPSGDLIGDFFQVRKAEFVAEALHLAAASPAGRDLRPEIADHLFGIAHVAPDQIEQHLVRLTGVVKAQHRNDQAFLKDLLREAGALAAADIDVMDRVDRKADELALVEGRRGNEDVRCLPIAEPRIVADEDIAGVHGLRRKGLDEVGAEGRHAAGVTGSAEPGLRHQVSPVVQEARRHIVHLDHVVAEGGAEHGRRHLVRDRDQAWPDDIQR